jgi:ABC-2 type transport system ATP-binding protein
MIEIIDISGLTKEYSGRKVVDNLNLQVDKGEIFGFLGPNGAGKTTTIRILTTLTKPTSGKVFINGFDVVRDPSKVKSEFGVVQQHLSLNKDLTIAENLELHARLHHLSRSERRKSISDLLAYVELSDHADYLIDDVSGGMKRRAMIARALIHRPKLLFMDEPTVGLDAQTRRKVWNLIRRMNSDGTTVFLTTHYIEEAETICERVGVLHHGNMIAIGSPLSLRQKLGMIAVATQNNRNETQHSYFPDRSTAAEFIQRQPRDNKVIMRESNLEDVFVEITGQKVLEN